MRQIALSYRRHLPQRSHMWVRNTAPRREKPSPASANPDGDPRPQSMTKTRSSTMSAGEIPARPATGNGAPAVPSSTNSVTMPTSSFTGRVITAGARGGRCERAERTRERLACPGVEGSVIDGTGHGPALAFLHRDGRGGRGWSWPPSAPSTRGSSPSSAWPSPSSASPSASPPPGPAYRSRGSCRLDLLPPPKAKTDLPERATVRGPPIRLPPSVAGGATRLPPARWIG